MDATPESQITEQILRGALRQAVNRLRNERGQAMVEFALLLPLVLAVVVGIVTFGRAMNYDEQATHLANEAARFAMVDQVPAGATGSLGQWVRSQVDTPELKNGTGSVSGVPSVCVSLPNGTSNVGDPIKVAMTFTFSWTPILKIPGASTTMTRSATMRIEVPPTNSFFATGCT
jgi:Flp pilus assembly protein TadG